MSRNTFKRHVDLLLISKEGKRQYDIIKDFSISIYDHTLHCRRK